jgi:transcriptional regulator with XRE-family HTH domain
MSGYSLSLVRRITSKQYRPFTQLALKAIERNVSIVEIATYLGVSRTAVYAWFLGKYEPSEDKFNKLEKYLGSMQKRI